MTNNNNNGDSCWVFVGSGQASKEGSYAVLPGKDIFGTHRLCHRMRSK